MNSAGNLPFYEIPKCLFNLNYVNNAAYLRSFYAACKPVITLDLWKLFDFRI